MGNNGKVWIFIGVGMTVIGLIFTVLFSSMSKNQINYLVESCESDGGEAVVVEKGIFITTSYQFECRK